MVIRKKYVPLTILDGDLGLLFTLNLYERVDTERISHTVLGIFDSKINAEMAIEALLSTNDFKNYTKLNFAISPMRADVLHWDGGFRSSNHNI